MEKQRKPELQIYIDNHFDLMHRRCLTRNFTYKGITYISYIKLHKYYILENMSLADKYPEYKFVIESPAVARHFIENNPEKLDELIQLVKAKRLYISGTGDNIIDSNLVSGESLARNFICGFTWVEDVFGQQIIRGNRADAFGNSAQIPQIMRGLGVKWCVGLSYSPPSGSYWRGLDGSVVYTRDLPSAGFGGHYRVYAPCPSCLGVTMINDEICPKCKGLGIDREEGDSEWSFSEIDNSAFDKFGCAGYRCGGEELLPNAGTAPWVLSLKDTYDAKYALPEEAYPYLRELIDMADNPPEDQVMASLELNPNNGGVYVTRIEVKKTARRQEHALFGAEILASMSMLRGKEYPAELLKKAWQQLFFTMFHDSITGTHVDPAYEELKDVWSEIDGLTAKIRSGALSALTQTNEAITVINTTGGVYNGLAEIDVKADTGALSFTSFDGKDIKVLSARQDGGHVKACVLIENLEPLSAMTLIIGKKGFDNPNVTDDIPVIQNQRFLITADKHGLLSIFDKKLQCEIARGSGCRPAEFILEHDEGSPWATLSHDMERTYLSGETRLEGVEKFAGYERLTFVIPTQFGYAEDSLYVRYSVTLWSGVDRIDFRAAVKWEDYNHRLRVAMPVSVCGRHFYEIPYGTVERQCYEPPIKNHSLMGRWSLPNGDWPALNWAGVETEGFSAALLNKGTPSYRIEAGSEGGDVILLTLVRGPCVPTYLHEPRAYCMADWDGMHDGGLHEFEFALTAYGCKFSESGVVTDAECYVRGLCVVPGTLSLPSMPVILSDHVRITAVKKAEHGEALILRLFEYRGVGGETKIKLPEYVQSVSVTNLLEKNPAPLEIMEGCVYLKMRAFEITTLLLELRK